MFERAFVTASCDDTCTAAPGVVVPMPSCCPVEKRIRSTAFVLNTSALLSPVPRKFDVVVPALPVVSHAVTAGLPQLSAPDPLFIRYVEAAPCTVGKVYAIEPA